MSGLPEVTVAGTVVADPEMKFFDSGACVANFTIASNDRRFDRESGEWVDAATTFLRCSIWRQQAENVVESLAKGTRVLATGALKQRSWETETGDKRSAMELAVTEVGVSLKLATAQARKPDRPNGSATSSGSDPWGSAQSTAAAKPAMSSQGSTVADEPPF